MAPGCPRHSGEIGLRGGRFAVLLWAVLFYGGFSLYLIYDTFMQLT